jgi:hypothetical protein
MRPVPGRSTCFALVAGGLLCLWPGPSILGDTVVLKTGEFFSGKVLRMNADEVSIQLESGGILSFRLNRVEQIRRLGTVEYGKENPMAKESEQDPRAPGDSMKSVPFTPLSEKPSRAANADGSRPAGRREKDDGKASRNAGLLSGFPLHSKKDPSVSDSSARVVDSEKGYSIVPPGGFKSWSDQKLPPMIRGFMDPATQSNLTISTYDSDESLERIKNGIASLLKQHSGAKILKESRRTMPGPHGYTGWVLSIQAVVGETAVHQLQLLAKDGHRAFVVTYSSSAKYYPSFAQAFEQSLESFRIERNADGEGAPGAPGGPGAAELKASSGFSGAPASGDATRPAASGLPGPRTEEEARKNYKWETDRMMDRVDERIRKAPLPYYPK